MYILEAFLLAWRPGKLSKHSSSLQPRNVGLHWGDHLSSLLHLTFYIMLLFFHSTSVWVVSFPFSWATVEMFDSPTVSCHLCRAHGCGKGTCCVGWHVLFGSRHEFSADMCALVTGVITALLAPWTLSPSPLALSFFLQRWPLYIIPLKWLCSEGWAEGQRSHLSKQDQWAMCFPLGSNKRKGLLEEKKSTKDQN